MTQQSTILHAADMMQQHVGFFGKRSKRYSVKAPVLILLVAVWVSLVDNTTLWLELVDRLAPFNGSSAGYVVSLLGLMIVLLALPLLFVGQRYLLKPLLLLVLGISGVLAYFTQQLGVVYDIEMVRNVTETVIDRNTQEGMELLSWSMLWFLLPTTVLPAVWVILMKVDYGTFLVDMRNRLLWAAGLFALVLFLVMLNFKYITYFSRENSDLEVYLNPFYPIKTTKQLFARQYEARHYVFHELGDDAVQSAGPGMRTVGIMVVGETSRGSNFSLNGYTRQTNPKLAERSVINFNQATSCGTSTAFSVPCMFSFLDEKTYTPEEAGTQSNVLDVLQKVGVRTVWVDSNSSCKGVCRRIESINLLDDVAKQGPLFVDGAWHDEVLLDYIDQYLDDTEGDVLIVLHTMGSHGPAYFRRYPDQFARFTPFCQSKAPQDCSEEEIVNAYDNTILYIDHVLASLIDKLDSRNDNSFLFYASDHGESLGENGVYLHGLPRFVAPAAQREVPMLAWISPELAVSRGWGTAADRLTQVGRPATHDNISASLMGLFRVQSSLYDKELDLFSDSLMNGEWKDVAMEQ